MAYAFASQQSALLFALEAMIATYLIQTLGLFTVSN
jgi:hypothetical protein